MGQAVVMPVGGIPWEADPWVWGCGCTRPHVWFSRCLQGHMRSKQMKSLGYTCLHRGLGQAAASIKESVGYVNWSHMDAFQQVKGIPTQAEAQVCSPALQGPLCSKGIEPEGNTVNENAMWT